MIHAHCVTTNAANLARDQPLHRFDRKSGKMHPSRHILVEITLGIRPTRSPACPEQHDSSLWYLAVPFLPVRNQRGWELVICVNGAFRSNIEYHSHSKKLSRRDLVNRCLPWGKMNWRIQMRPVMLQHPKAAREVTVFLHAGIVFGLEPPLVARPRHQFVVDGIREV